MLSENTCDLQCIDAQSPILAARLFVAASLFFRPKRLAQSS
ncbi:hypothetical protein BRUCa_3111 [Brucella melitensis]|nr:conserved hypothetical protein [Brucella melitensis M28]ADZ89065.1 conserved hypothetical protein [Brucella melitensis M5-90]AEW18951.1 hypothetical protein BAA13334_II00632 [Brucella abortus A13334]EFM63360.1 Hypothetical protein BROD_0582 [Brucella sp. NF 2653]